MSLAATTAWAELLVAGMKNASMQYICQHIYMHMPLLMRHANADADVDVNDDADTVWRCLSIDCYSAGASTCSLTPHPVA